MPDTVQLATIRNVPVAKVGPARLWKGGQRVFTEADLLDAVRASQDPEVGAARVKLAHEHQLDTGEPAFGTYQKLRWDADTETVYGDLTGVPLWLAKVLPTFYPNRSFEAAEDVTTASGKYRLAFRAIGSLGIKMPAIKGLADLRSWASADMPAGVTLAAAEGTEPPTWGDTAIEPETATAGGDLQVDIRALLKLAADATDEQVAEAVKALEAQAAAGAPEALDKLRADALAEAQSAADAAAAAKIAEAEKAATSTAQEAERKRLADAGMVLVEAAAYDDLKAQATRGATAADTIDRQRRTALVDAKIAKGAIAPASRDKLLANLEAGAIDEDVITALPDGVLPIDKSTLGAEDTGDGLEGAEAAFGTGDDWMAHLLRDDERAALAAAQKGA